VNPDHLYVGTPKDNMNDAMERGTFKNLHDGRDRFWSTKNKDERRQITKNGADGVKKYHASLSKEEKSERARKAARSRWSKP
jgi:hypothetical protein